MAILQEGDSFQRSEARRKATELKRGAIEKYGQALGEAFYEYAKESSSHVSIESRRRLFSEELVNLLENGTREDKILALDALLRAVEKKIEPVAKEAHSANIATSTF